MELGMVGPGRMGANLVRRLLGADHHYVVFDIDPDAVKRLENDGATGASTLAELVTKLSAPRGVWASNAYCC